MDSTLVILFFLLHVLTVGTGMPLPQDKSNIDLKIKTLMVRLKTLPNLDLEVTPPTELRGFSSIAASLEGYNRLISEDFLDVIQVKTDISELANTINKLNCTLKNPELILPKRLHHLQTEWKQDPIYYEAVSLEALYGVKEILKLLKDKFDSITGC